MYPNVLLARAYRSKSPAAGNTGRGQAPTVAAAAATAVAAISADSVEDLERFVEAGAISGLTRGLVSGHADEAAACAAALAVIARLPSAHSHLLRSGACDVILRCAGSRVRCTDI